VSERQLVRAYERASKVQGKTGEALIIELERRLDALVLRSGIARTIYQSRQMVVHGHIEVNGRKVDKPSYRLRPQDVVRVRERSREKTPFLVAREGGWAPDGETPRYLQVNLAALAFSLDRDPNRHEIPVVCDEQLVVEFYAR
jgi:small subunit ribosomal protein S4